jgi:ubiquinone biosynthesis protein Coq4
MDIILAGWTHGRRAPSLVSLEWEEVWHRSMDDIRQSIGLKAFDSPYPADIIEQLRAAA